MAPLAELMLGCQTCGHRQRAGGYRNVALQAARTERFAKRDELAARGCARQPGRGGGTFVMNRILGGTKGYWSSSSMLT